MTWKRTAGKHFRVADMVFMFADPEVLDVNSRNSRRCEKKYCGSMIPYIL